MNKLNFCHLVLYFVCLVFISCQGFRQNIPSGVSNNRFTEIVDALIIGKINHYDIPGLAIGLVANDSIIYSKGYGIKSIKKPIPVTDKSNFHTASISKLFTAQAIMILISENKIALNDRLIDIAPKLKYTDHRVEDITIRSLLNHTSGLPDVSNFHWRFNNRSDKSLENYILSLNLNLKCAPETRYYYSNLGYNILGYIIEKIAKTSFEVFLKNNVLNANGMRNSDFRYYEISDSLRTSPHSKHRITKSIVESSIYPYTREQAPSSTLNSSAKDISRWMTSFLKSLDSVNDEHGFVQMIEPSFDSYPHIGLGFQLSRLDSMATIGHFGGDKGYRSYVLMIPAEKLGLVLLANCDYDEDFRQEILHPIAKLMLATYNKS